MRIFWNKNERRFEAELTGTSFKSDLEAIKAAGFRTSGPPSWHWFTTKAEVLNKLRTNRPPSGLTLTEVALAEYQKLNTKLEEKAALKKQFKDANKKAKKESKDPEISGLVDFVPAGLCSFGCVCTSAKDLPPIVPKYVPKVFAAPETTCVICSDPLYLPLDLEDVCYVCNQ